MGLKPSIWPLEISGANGKFTLDPEVVKAEDGVTM